MSSKTTRPELDSGRGSRPLRVLVVTNLFPNRCEPERGIFNIQQLSRLAGRCEIEVIAPIPWIPRIVGRLGGAWERRAAIPRRDTIEGIAVSYPRYPVVPKTLRSLHGASAALALRRPMVEAHAARNLDVVLATWVYPDVVAAVAVAWRLGVPVVASVHGSDVLRALRSLPQRWMVRRALRRAQRVVAPSRVLAEQVAALGVDRDRVEVITNGVNAELFRPLDAAAARLRLGLPADVPRVVCVARLEAVKGPDVLIEAARGLDRTVAVTLVGDGAWRHRIAEAVRAAGLADRVTLTGARPHAEIPTWLAAADVVCVPSRAEGFANAGLEALACGRPVVGSRVGALPDLITGPELGTLVAPGDPAALCVALNEALTRVWDCELISRSVAEHTWERSADGLLAELQAAVRSVPPRRLAVPPPRGCPAQP